MKLAIATILALSALTTGCSYFYSPAAAAEWAARKSVEKRLTSPGSAKFEVSKIAARAENEQLYLVYLAVDSQNNYGALVRTHALALVRPSGEFGGKSIVLQLSVTKDSPSVGRIKDMTREAGGAWTLAEWVAG